jgi:hypothetical protein
LSGPKAQAERHTGASEARAPARLRRGEGRSATVAVAGSTPVASPTRGVEVDADSPLVERALRKLRASRASAEAGSAQSSAVVADIEAAVAGIGDEVGGRAPGGGGGSVEDVLRAVERGELPEP